jgi:hypothetical protein
MAPPKLGDPICVARKTQSAAKFAKDLATDGENLISLKELWILMPFHPQ